MKFRTLKEIQDAPINEYGWHVLDNGDWVKLGKWVKLGDRVKLGDGVKLGNGVELGDNLSLFNTRPIMCIYGKYIGNEYCQGSVRIGCEVHTIIEFKKQLHELCIKHCELEMESAFRVFLETVEKYQKKFPIHKTEVIENES